MSTRRFYLSLCFAVIFLARVPEILAQPAFVNGLLNGLTPFALTNDAGILGRSFDPEGLVIDPRTGHLLIADEYGPSVYEFSRKGKLLRVFLTPENLIPKAGTSVNYVAPRDACVVPQAVGPVPPLCGLSIEGGAMIRRHVVLHKKMMMAVGEPRAGISSAVASPAGRMSERTPSRHAVVTFVSYNRR